jgi:hypothetical protein
LLTSTPSRSHRSKTRSLAVALVVVVVLAVLAGAGYAVTRNNKTPAASSPSPAATTTTSAAPATAAAPASAAPVDDVIAFVALPIGSPPTAGTGDHHYPWYQLSATLTGPHTAAVGSTAQFTVRLRNPTSAAIALAPCPAFDLTVGYQTTSYGLNCAGAGNDVIPPGGMLTFALPVPIAHSLASGSSTDVAWSLGWQPDAHSPHAHQAVHVTG